MTIPMKPEYDFSRAERGKFYRKGAEIRLPIYLDAKLQHRLEQVAKKKRQRFGPSGESNFDKGSGTR